jgi:hypothetical protein
MVLPGILAEAAGLGRCSERDRGREPADVAAFGAAGVLLRGAPSGGLRVHRAALETTDALDYGECTRTALVVRHDLKDSGNSGNLRRPSRFFTRSCSTGREPTLPTGAKASRLPRGAQESAPIHPQRSNARPGHRTAGSQRSRFRPSRCDPPPSRSLSAKAAPAARPSEAPWRPGQREAAPRPKGDSFAREAKPEPLSAEA